MNARTSERLEAVRSALAAARESWGETGEIVLDPRLSYGDGEPVRILFRKRGHRQDLDDRGAAVRKAGRPRGWLEAAERLVAEEGLNVNGAGVLFVRLWKEGNLASLVLGLADMSLAVYGALLELADDEPR